MASNAITKYVACVLLFVTSVSAIVGPSNSFSNAGLFKKLPQPCPINCYCSGNEARCEKWPSSRGINYDSFVLPRRTRTLSFKFLPDSNFNASAILSPLSEMRWLRIQTGELVNFPNFPELPHLLFLDLSINKLSHLPSHAFNNTPHIVHLNISGNELTNISSTVLDNLTDLKELDLSRNPYIFQLPENFFSHLTMLKFLDISGTNVDNFPVQWASSLQDLQFLNASHNNIVLLPKINLLNLETLDISSNPLLSLPTLEGFPYLTHLFVSHTLISYLRTSETEGCKRLTLIDLRSTNLTNLNEGVLGKCRDLIEIDLSHNQYLWRIEHGAFANLKNLTILRLNNCPALYDVEDDSLNTLHNLRELYFQESGVKVLPYSLKFLSNLTVLNLESTSLFCDCYAHWLPDLFVFGQHQNWKGVDVIQCNDGVDRTPMEIENNLEQLNCTKVEAYTEQNIWVLAPWGQSALLECNVTGNPMPKIIWQTVDHHLHVFNKSMADNPWIGHQISEAISVAQAKVDSKYEVLQSGQLLIRDITRKDIGRYRCFAFNPVSNSSIVSFLGLDDAAYKAFILESILFGFTCAALFLLTTLVVQLIRYIMNRLGLECCCCKNRLSPKAKQVRQLIETVESYKSAQLEKLRENYTSQVANIKDSCYQQMERVRESYAHQSKNLKDLCDYSTLQFSGARDQYLDQVNKIRDYSMGQMNRVRENYVFQRHRIRKFSGHQLLRLRETYKYQQKTLNKLLETLPDLYIQNCRTGTCQRSDSIIFEDQIDGLDVYYKVDFLDNQSYSSDYYTPNSTLTRHSKSGKGSHSRDPSSVSGGTEYQETHSWVVRQESTGSEKSRDHPRLHTRSFSIASPQSIMQRFDSNREHRRSISVSSHPSPSAFQPKPPLEEESTENTSTSSPSRETPLYTPLSLTPVHNPKFIVSKVDNDEVCKTKSTTVESDVNSVPLELDVKSLSLELDVNSLPLQLNESKLEKIANIKIEVQKSQTNCDSSSEEAKDCDSDVCDDKSQAQETPL